MFKIVNKNVNGRRELKTVDIVKRLITITANEVELRNHPINKPTTIFNPSLTVDPKKDEVRIYARIVLGYFTYASAVAEFSLPLSDLYSCDSRSYIAEITVYPDTRYDYWGVEDPRVYEIDNKLLMTYCGRTVNYFNPTIRMERTLPVTAVFKNGKWRKICVFRTPPELRSFVISDKDAFIVKMKELMLFHRLHLMDERFYLTISKIPESIDSRKLKEISVSNPIIALEPAKFELKTGWSTPPIKIGKEFLMLIHSVDKETQCYRVFAILINEECRITAITPYYIMEPKESYEIYGDRPYTVFPCGSQLVDDKILLSYGAADSVVGIGEIEVSELMNILDKNRIE
ncbi:MAG: glycosidase [Candidatus Altiarchaeales archaeon]|nr:MAG: glycosidase [Candidatus Altiarchaeales archaeon]